MSRTLDTALDNVHALVLAMSVACEAILDKALRSLEARDLALANQVAHDDLEIDRLDVAVDEAILGALALQAPVAEDLRRVLAAKAIGTDLERVGDLARNIAKCTQRLVQRSPVPLPPSLEVLVLHAKQMLRGALDAYVERDADKARMLLREDDVVDDDQDRVVREALREIREHPDTSEQEIDLIFVAKHLERVADHATNVAESVILLVEARNVKHADKLGAAAAS
jgi:phosphate transport system protein